MKEKNASVLLIVAVVFMIKYSPLLAQQYPFPQQVRYENGLRPNIDQSVMNANMQSKFVKWRSVYLTSEGAPTRTKRINAINQNNETYSEGISYGMTLLVYMDNGTNNTRDDFDALLGYYKHYLNDKGLMKWKIDADGIPLDDGFAGDGDEEVAFALLMADKQWGSDGSVNYLEEAVRIIQQLKIHNVQPNFTFSDGSGSWIFPAYQLPNQWKIFAEVIGDNDWNKTIAKGYSLLNIFYGNSTGLMYDAFGPTGAAVTASHEVYGYDACRVPWRICTDYLWNGLTNNVLARDLPAKMADWAKIKWQSKPGNAKARYKIDGTEAATYGDFGCMVGPMAVGAMAGTDQAWLNTLATFTLNIPVGNNYYADHVCLLSLLTLTGNMPNLRQIGQNTSVEKKIEQTHDGFRVYPNPALTSITLSNLEQNSVLKIFDANGKVLSHNFISYDTLFLNVGGWNRGVYVFCVENETKKLTERVLIQ
jgi:endo-1,4-beta-D-glucanase Y